MSRTWAELTWTLHEQNLHEQNVNENTWAETHDQNLISRTWAETHDRSRTSAELTRAGQEQNPHERDMGRTWPQFIRAGHEENANEQDMKGIIRISYDKSTYIYMWNKNVRRHNWFNKFDWWWIPIPVKGAEIPVPLPELPCRFIFERPDSYYAHIFLEHHMATFNIHKPWIKIEFRD